MTLTFDLMTPKSIGVFLSLSSICMKYEVSRLKSLVIVLQQSVDRRTDAGTDRQTKWLL